MDDAVESAITDYRAELTANAAVGAAELDELEDHLRALIDELRAAGATTTAAIHAARTRLGAPGAIATECARVRTAFGTRLDRGRAWAAAAILLVPSLWTMINVLPSIGVVSRLGAESALALILIAGLVTRRTWPRAVLFGFSAMSVMTLGYFTLLWPRASGLQLTFAVFCATTALLAPWRRGELTRAGWALALWTMTYVGSWAAVSILVIGNRVSADHLVLDRVLPASVLLGVFVAALGTALRARWGAIVGFGAAAVMAVVAVRVAASDAPGIPLAAWQRVLGIGLALVSTAAAIAAPVLAWRESRPGRGDPRSLLIA